MISADDSVEYSKREHVARLVLRAIGTGYDCPLDQSLCDAGESIYTNTPRAKKAVDIADEIIAVMKSKRRTWPRAELKR